MKHDISDPITIASVLVRDHLDTVIQRHAALLRVASSERVKAESRAVVTLVTALLQHLPGEAKQARADKDSTRTGEASKATDGVAAAPTVSEG